jgi:hypothetical protein
MQSFRLSSVADGGGVEGDYTQLGNLGTRYRYQGVQNVLARDLCHEHLRIVEIGVHRPAKEAVKFQLKQTGISESKQWQGLTNGQNNNNYSPHQLGQFISDTLEPGSP